MFKRLLTSKLTPFSKSITFKPLLPYSNSQPDPEFNIPPSEAWKQFPFIPFFQANTKLGLLLGIPALAGYLVPHEIAFDVLAITAAAATVPIDQKFMTMNPDAPPAQVYGKPLTTKFVSYASYGVSCLVSFGLFGEYYLYSSIFTLTGYLAFMGAYRLATQFIPPETLDAQKTVLLGSLASTTVLSLLTDLSDIAPPPIMDLTNLMPPVYFLYSYFAGMQFLKVYKDVSTRMAVHQPDLKIMEGDNQMQGILSQLEIWKIDHYMTKFLITYKWINIGAYLILLAAIAIARQYGVRERSAHEDGKRHSRSEY